MEKLLPEGEKGCVTVIPAPSFRYTPEHLAKIYHSSSALDLYGWVSYQIGTHSTPTRVAWQQLKDQIGTSYPDTPRGEAEFQTVIRRFIESISRAWSESGLSEWRDGVIVIGNPAIY